MGNCMTSRRKIHVDQEVDIIGKVDTEKKRKSRKGTGATTSMASIGGDRINRTVPIRKANDLDAKFKALQRLCRTTQEEEATSAASASSRKDNAWANIGRQVREMERSNEDEKASTST